LMEFSTRQCITEYVSINTGHSQRIAAHLVTQLILSSSQHFVPRMAESRFLYNEKKSAKITGLTHLYKKWPVGETTVNRSLYITGLSRNGLQS